MSNNLLTQTITIQPQSTGLALQQQPGFDSSLANQRWHQAMEQAQAMLWLRAKPSLQPLAAKPNAIQTKPSPAPSSQASAPSLARTLHAIPKDSLSTNQHLPSSAQSPSASLRPLRVSPHQLHDQRLGAEREGFTVMTPNTSISSPSLGSTGHITELGWPGSTTLSAKTLDSFSQASTSSGQTPSVLAKMRASIAGKTSSLEPCLIRMTCHRRPDGIQVWLGVHSKFLLQGLSPQALLNQLRQVFALHPKTWSIDAQGQGTQLGSHQAPLTKVIVNGSCLYWRQDGDADLAKPGSFISAGQTNAEPQAFLFDM